MRPPAVEMLDEFAERALPTMLRRMRCWKGLSSRRHADVLADLRQDLLLDCLENAAALAAMTPLERHARWFRLLERRHYQLRVRDGRLTEAASDPNQVAEPMPASLALRDVVSDPDCRVVQKLLRAARSMKNGRLNAEATAGRLGLHPRDVRAVWGRVTAALGYDEQFLAFWRQRLVEALVGLAADLLRDRGLVRLHAEGERARPDPRGRLRRIAQIKRRLSVRPLPAELRAVLAQFTRRRLLQRLDPWLALQAALRLQPACPRVLLWHFENAVAHGLLREAARALRRARAAGADTVRLVLARARLLEARVRVAAAAALLRRAAARHRGDTRLTASLTELRER
jgi:hypothetical protein